MSNISKKKVWTTDEVLENLKERWLDMKLSTREYNELVAEVKEEANNKIK